MTYSKVPLDKLDAAFKSIGYEPIPSWLAQLTRDIYVNSEKTVRGCLSGRALLLPPISFIGRLELDFRLSRW